MHLKELNYIVTLAEAGSISRAAERLYMAQSSLSQFLHQYESELGISLFVRTSKGIHPTSAGVLFIENARSILYHYHLVQNELWDMAKLQGGRVILGISSFRGCCMLPGVLKIFYKQYPKVKVEIIEANSMALEEKILDGSLDLAVVALPLVKLNHEVDFLKKDEIFIVANKNHPVMKYIHPKDNSPYYWIELCDAAQFEFVLSDYDTILGSIARKEFKKIGVIPISNNSNITAAMAAAMAAECLGLAFTYHSCAKPYEDVVYLSIGKDGVFLDLALAYPYAEYRSKAALALSKILREFHK